MTEQSIQQFVEYAQKHIKGDEKGEAQIFLDHFFISLGFKEGLKGAGAECEFRIKNKERKSTSFADLVWKPRVLIKMKKRGENLLKHYQQAFSYWQQLVPNRPQYVILCNFDEFWVYDFDFDIDEPVDKIELEKLVDRRQSLTFLLPVPKKPIWGANKDEITNKAVKEVGYAFKAMIKRGIDRKKALLYCMQCVVSMFAEDIGLLPNNIFTTLVSECLNKAGDEPGIVPISYDLIGNLFKEMNTQGIAEGGMYKGVDYFNGGLFLEVNQLELTRFELERFQTAACKKWQHVNPGIFGSIFESALETDERHQLGAHYTHEIDIRKIVYPVIVQPWEKKIAEAKTLDDYYKLINELRNFKVLDPACGSGNFLFVAFKEMKKLEKTLLTLIREKAQTREEAKEFQKFFLSGNYVSTKQFYGIDIKPYAVELAKVTLMVAKELTIKEATDNSEALPLDNLDENIICADALMNEDGTERQWTQVDAIIGNPPYQSKNKMQAEFGREYINKLRKSFPTISGHADFCVYWFYKAHKHLKENCYAGLVGTNTIRENFSRQGGLDFIVNNNGTIIDAVSTKPWSGEAAVSVSIVNWKKGDYSDKKILYYSDLKNNLTTYSLEYINSSLSINTDVSIAKKIKANSNPKTCFQGHTHGYSGFLLSVNEAKRLIDKEKNSTNVLKPFLIGNELVGKFKSQPQRFVIDFSKYTDINSIESYKSSLKIIEEKVLPEIIKKALSEKESTGKSGSRQNHLNRWWQFWAVRHELINTLKDKKMYIACSRVMLRPIFDFVSTEIIPNDKIVVFPFDDFYSYGIIQSILHWSWLKAQCTTLENRYNYNLSIWETFPWPQNPTEKQIDEIAKISKTLRDERNAIMEKNKSTLRDVYRILEKPGKNKLKDLHSDLDNAVIEAYGFDAKKDLLQQLLELNEKVAQLESKGTEVQAPGLPNWINDKQKYISEDCVKFIE